MLTADVVASEMLLPGDESTLRADLDAGRTRPMSLDEPVRPISVASGRWRRMSRLSRLVAVAAEPLLDGLAQAPIVYGSALGEVVPSAVFLRRMFEEGGERGSPMAFQNSVTNATPGHLSLAYGLRGPCETVSAGLATGLMALARGMEWLSRAEEVLVVVADDRNPTSTTAYGSRRYSEMVVCVRLRRGSNLVVVDGDRDDITWSRHQSVPYERLATPKRGRAVDKVLGLHGAAGLATVLAVPGWVRDHDSGLTVCGMHKLNGEHDCTHRLSG